MPKIDFYAFLGTQHSLQRLPKKSNYIRWYRRQIAINGVLADPLHNLYTEWILMKISIFSEISSNQSSCFLHKSNRIQIMDSMSSNITADTFSGKTIANDGENITAHNHVGIDLLFVIYGLR